MSVPAFHAVRTRRLVPRLAAVGPRWLLVLAGIAGAVACQTGIVAGDLSSAGRASLAVTSLSVGLWASEVLALPVTALLAVTLLYAMKAVAQPEQALSGFGSPVLFFLLGSAGLGIAAQEAGLTERLAAWLLAHSRGSGRRLLLDLLISMPVQAFIVPSALSRNAILVPVYDHLLERIGRPPRLGMAVMLTLGIIGPLASSALLSGGTSPVAAAQAIGGFTWLTWFRALAPPYYLLLALGGVAVWVYARPERDITVDAEAQVGPGKLRAAEWRVAAVLIVTALLWMGDQFTRWPPAIPALLALVALMLPGFGVMSWDRFAAKAPWGTCTVLAGATSLGSALSSTGAAAWVAHGLFGRLAGTSNQAAMVIAVFIVTALIALTIPNRAAAITLGVPLAAAYAHSGPLAGAAAGLIVMIAVDAETIYPAQTATNLLAYDRGYFSAGQLARFNLITIIIAALVTVFVALPWWGLVGLPAMR
ncbi:MAG: SLC13 family permease [Dehalococcoidia bacterium]